MFKIGAWIQLIIGLMAIQSMANGQERIYNYLHFTVREGLPGDRIRDAAVDKLGLVWITTDKGLCYFDGHTFFPVSFDREHEDFSHDFGSLSIGENNKIWIASYNQGLLCYDRNMPPQKAWTKYSAKVNAGELEKHELYAVYESNNKVYFGGQETDLQVLDLQTGQVTSIRLNTKTCETIFRIDADKHGVLWIGTRYHGIYTYDPGSKQIVHYDLRNAGENAVNSFCFIGDKTYAAYYDHDIIGIVSGKKQIVQKNILGIGHNITPYDNSITDISYFSEESKLMAAHSSGRLFSYDLVGHQRTEIPWTKDIPAPHVGVKINRIVSMLHGYFLCTDQGLFYYSETKNLIHDFIPANKKPINKLINVAGRLWYLTDDEIGELSLDFRRRLSAVPLKKFKISQISSVDNRIYISTLDRGVYVFDTSTNDLRPLPIAGKTFGMERADCNKVVLDTLLGKQILWIGSWSSGLYQYDLSTKRITLYNKKSGLVDHKVITVAKDGSGALWLGMDGFGAVRIVDKIRMKFMHYTYQKDSFSLASNTIFAFLLDADHNFWYSSSRQGIGRIMEHQDMISFQQKKDPNPFPRVYAHTLKADKENRIWMIAPEGGTIFDSRNSSFRQLKAGDGIAPPARFAIRDLYLDADVLLWLTDKGIIKGDINQTTKADVVFRPVISAFKILNKENSFRLLNKKISLEPGENTFSFHFSELGHLGDRYLRYSYKLEGVDQDWMEADGIQQAVYTNIPGGDYRFHLRVGDLNGNWSTEQVLIPVVVKSMWYQSRWFRIALIGFIFVVIILILLYRIRQQKKLNQLQQEFTLTLQRELAQNEQQIREQAEILELEKEQKLASEFRQKLYESELKAIRSQMNPHFIFNILNSIEAYVVEKDAQSASKLIHKFAALSRIVLENSQFSMVSVASEIQLVKLYLDLERERFGHIFCFVIQVDDELVKSKAKIPSMLIQPIVENAVHHGLRHLNRREGKILIRVNADERKIRIEILDNGVGFTSESRNIAGSFKTTSFGLKGVEERLRMINGESGTEIAAMIIDKNPKEEDFTVKISIILPL